PDRLSVDEDGKRYVALNLGYSFAPQEQWNFQHIQAGASDSKSAGLGVAFGNGSVNIGASVSQSDNFTTYALMDVNGDGLPDQVSKPKRDDPVQVRLNTGSGFADPVVWTGATHINENSSTHESINGSFTIGVLITPVTPIVNIYINPSGSKGHGLSREEAKFADIDGDGFPDFVRSKHDGELYVHSSNIGRTNLLKSVKRPLGASFDLSYSYIGNTFDMPNGAWVLDSVKVFDGKTGDGVDHLLTTFAYEGGKYDRREREFLGFARVITRTHNTGEEEKPVYTEVAQTFANDNYYTKGLLLSETMTDGDGNKYVEKVNEYELRNLETSKITDIQPYKEKAEPVFPALIATVQKFYEGEADPGKQTRTTYDYDVRGNVVTYVDYGDEAPD